MTVGTEALILILHSNGKCVSVWNPIVMEPNSTIGLLDNYLFTHLKVSQACLIIRRRKPVNDYYS
jgi:hypothetical protein